MKRAVFIALFFSTALLRAAPSPEGVEFFERNIRPILVRNCYKCHSAESNRSKGGLRVDTREALLKGGDTGPAIVPGQPDQSLLIRAVRYKDSDLQMPPDDAKLPDSDIAVLDQWVRMGAPDPRDGKGAVYLTDKEKAARHWAWQPIFPPEPPTPADTNGWALSDTDRYILAKLQEQGLQPSASADKRTLIRRATFDLTGLPPSLPELESFLNDSSTNAFEKVVDRLLASPRYGEAWGRRWLDLARYADTKGSNDQEQRYLYAHTYRDYVISAFNADLPYNQFLLEQIAADQLPGALKQSLAALGFLTLGNRFNNRQDEIIDDRIGVLSKATLGLTVTCARCHDHKFDPIPAADYYSWHGIFASSQEPEELPEIDGGGTERDREAFNKTLAEKRNALAELKRNGRLQTRKNLVSRGGDFMVAAAEIERSTNSGVFRNNYLDARGLNRRWAGAWEKAVQNARTQFDPVLSPFAAVSRFATNEFAARAPVAFAKLRDDASNKLNPHVARLLNPPPATLRQLAARYQTLFADVATRWDAQERDRDDGKSTGLSDANLEAIRLLFDKSGAALNINDRLIDDIFNNDGRARGRIATLEREINDLQANHPGAPRRAHVLVDKRDARDSRVYQRGNSGSQGALAPRRFLQILSNDQRPVFRNGSGRLDLAKAIVSEENPLTPRVIVNRIWQWRFGEGIVRTPDDFGLRSEPPTHPELLDYLAWTFVEDGWSMKKLHRRIMLSRVYQQASEDNARLAQADPESRWLWRFNRRRLDFESLRDTILFIGGRLDTNMGGTAVRLDAVPFPERRSVYGFIDRNNIPTMMRAFDFPHPDLSTGRRDVTTTPQQALFLMNSPLVLQQAMNLTRRPDFAAAKKPEDKIRLLYSIIYNRAPTETELRLALEYVAIEPRMPRSQILSDSPWEFGVGQFDPATKRVRGFAAMNLFTNAAWRLGAAALTAEGGHASANPAQAVIRRWNVPKDGRVKIDGSLFGGGSGDGVQGLIVSSRAGLLGSYNSHGLPTDTEVAPFQVSEGDTIDFLVFCKANAAGDVFTWNPIIRLSAADAPTEDEGEAFDAIAGFVSAEGGPRFRMDAWQKYAHALLETNELTYYD